jgi:hypothetical protein
VCVGGVCSVKSCSPTCACGQTCSDGKCIAVVCDAGGVKCGCGCCSSGQTCQAGACVATPPVP